MTKRKLPEPYFSRAPDLARWQTTFGEDFPLADRILCIFCDAFLFDADERYKFDPADTVTAIFRTVYPARCPSDAIQQPILIEALEHEFNYRFPPGKLAQIESLHQLIVEIRKTRRT